MRNVAIAVVAGAAMTLAACNRSEPEPVRTAHAPPRIERPALTPEPTIDPATAFADVQKTTPLPSSKGGSPLDQEHNVQAQWAAANAPDTASADAAKKRVLEAAAKEPSTSMPEPGQTNNHSTPESVPSRQ